MGILSALKVESFHWLVLEPSGDFSLVALDLVSQRPLPYFYCCSLSATGHYAITFAPAQMIGFQTSQGGLVATTALLNLQKNFEENILKVIKTEKDAQTKCDPPTALQFHSCSSCGHDNKDLNESSDASSDSSGDEGKTRRKDVRTKMEKQSPSNKEVKLQDHTIAI